MSYLRVIPRDLFNEGNLLKCLGQLYLNLDKIGMADRLVHSGAEFEIDQSDDDGSISVTTVVLYVGDQACYLRRPLNSRRHYPLYFFVSDDQIDVFNEDGTFTTEMLTALGAT